jgi:hypothetical protein
MAANTADVSLAYAGETITVTYYPARISEEMLAQLDSLETMSNLSSALQGFGSLNNVLANLIKEWDLYEDEKMTIMIPIEPERLKALGIELLVKIFYAIITNFRPE